MSENELLTHEETFQRCPHDKENPYVMISKKLINSPNLSPACKWFLIFLQTCSSNQISREDLDKQTNGRFSKILDELMQHKIPGVYFSTSADGMLFVNFSKSDGFHE